MSHYQLEEITLRRNVPLPAEVQVGSDDQIVSDSESKGKTSSDEPLYPGANVSIGVVMVVLTIYAIKYALMGNVVTHLLQLISLILPSGNVLPDILQKFKLTSVS